MPLLSSSKTGLKRSRLFAALLLILSLPLYPLHADGALDLRSQIAIEGKRLLIELEATGLPAEELKEALERGHTAEIRFDLRVYAKRSGILSILGDAMEEEYTRSYTGMWNPIFEVYSLIAEGERRIYPDFTAFLRDFASVRFSPDIHEPLSNEHHLRVRARLTPEVPVPPFNLLAPFLPNLRITTPWHRLRLET